MLYPLCGVTAGDLPLRRPGLEAVTQLKEKEGSKRFSVCAWTRRWTCLLWDTPETRTWNREKPRFESDLLPPAPAN